MAKTPEYFVNLGRDVILLFIYGRCKDHYHTQNIFRMKFNYLKITPLAFLAWFGSLSVETSASKLHGSVIFSSSSDATPGIYVFDTEDASAFAPVAGAEGILSQGGGVYADGYYYSIHAQENLLNVYDTDTWSVSRSVPTQLKTLDMTYDESDGKIYGCFVDQNPILGVFDTEKCTYEAIGIMRIPPVTLMADGKGALYCIGMDGTLYSVDKSNGNITTIGFTDVYPFSAQSAVIDSKTGKCYWAATRDDYTSGLYEVDLTDGHVTLLYDFPGQEEITGLCILPEAAASAPGMPQDLFADFSNGSTTGTLTFTMPLNTVGGEALPSALLWTLVANDVEKSGTAAPGEKVAVPLELAQGMYKFAVSVTASGEESKKGILSKWIGHDRPLSPEKLAIEKKSATSVVLSWDAPKGGVHGGYVELSALRYDIVRYPGEVTVATDYAATSFEDVVEATRLASYSYVVTAKANGMESEEVTSASVAMGAAKEIPFAEDFSSTLSFKTFMVADANGDGFTWGHDVGAEKVVYPGHNVGNADDWLITPPLALESGMNYCVKFDVCANTFTPYVVEAMLGGLPNVKDLSVRVVSPTDLTQPYKLQTLQANFHVNQSGDYYIGIHSKGVPNSGTLDLDNLSVEVLGASSAPEAPSDLRATAYEKGALGAEITMNAPTKTINGVSLDGSKCTVELFRGDKLIHTFSDVEPGAVLKHSDKEAAAGMNTYKAVSYNSDGVGESSVVEVWVGIDQPSAVRSLAVKEVEDGKVEITWEAPIAGVHGGYVDASALTYTVLRNDWKEVVSGTKALKAEDVVDDYAGQSLVVYSVTAMSAGGAGEPASSDGMIVGTPYPIPFRESFAGGRAETYPWTTLPMNVLMSWTPSPDEQFASQDGDGGIMSTYVYEEDALGSTLVSPKVGIVGAVNPVLEFYLAHSAIDDDLVVEIIADSEAPVEVERVSLGAETLIWEKVTVPLDDFIGKSSVQLLLSCSKVGGDDHIHVDNISIVDDIEHNLAALTPQFPVMIMAGIEAKAVAPVANVGVADAEGYTVKLYSGDSLLGQAQGEKIAAGESGLVEIAFVADAAYVPAIDIHTVVEYDADQNEANNRSATVSVAMETVGYPAPSALHGRGTDSGVDLQWNAPDLSKVGLKYTKEDFEGLKSFTTTELGEWKAVEGDPSHDASMEFRNGAGEWIVFPGDYAWQNMAFTVVDLSQLPNATAADGWSCVSGTKFLMTPYSSATQNPMGSYVGDYLISPRLKGCAQQITLNAKSLDYDTWGLETIEILVSSTDSELSSFKVLDEVVSIPTEWTRYRFSLPEGTLYFAIYSKQTQTALFLDDISYIAADAEIDTPEIKGYNVYRDKVRQNAELLTALNFSDCVADLEQDYEYAVSAMYASGESALSAPVKINPASLEGVEAAVAFEVVATRGAVTVRNCEGMDVVLSTIDGKVLGRATGGASVTFGVLPGFYVVTVGGQSVKVAVR